jgi:monofunctional glycosyltransferase
MMKVLRAIGRGTAAVLGIGFVSAAYVYLTLPDVRLLRDGNPSTTAFMELRALQAHARGVPVTRDWRWVPYSRISANLKKAVITTEDGAFWEHEGIDYEQLRDAVETNWERGEFARGASTITQQLAKNLYLSPSKNPIRKVKELLITRRLEVELSKQRILEIYLNSIEWGDGIWGAEAAARTYFGVPASALGPQQAALLAGAIINPRALNPARPTARLLRRQRIILSRMGEVTPPPAVPIVAAAPDSVPDDEAQPLTETPEETIPTEPPPDTPPESTPPVDAAPPPEPAPFPEPPPPPPAPTAPPA